MEIVRHNQSAYRTVPDYHVPFIGTELVRRPGGNHECGGTAYVLEIVMKLSLTVFNLHPGNVVRQHVIGNVAEGHAVNEELIHVITVALTVTVYVLHDIGIRIQNGRVKVSVAVHRFFRMRSLLTINA